jgi:hypothetical protein
MRRPGDCRGDIMQEINSLTQLTISPRGWGIFCLLLLFWYGIQSQSPPISRGGGGGGGGGSVFTLTGAL